MIDWSKLKAGHRDRTGSFEELCYQLAKGIHGSEARFVSVDDSGGGDGVEFYATFPDGKQWGWQAKFFYPDARLTAGRKTQIKKSLQRACDVHPGLTDWFLCMPADLTPNERRWFEEGLRGSRVNGRPTVPGDRKVELRFWGHDDISGWLSEERFAGKSLYFFGELELSPRWFREQVEKQISGVREKYERSLHTETHDDQLVHALLGDDKLADDLARRLGVLREDLADFDRWVDDLIAGKPHVIDWGHKREPLIEAAGDLRIFLSQLVEGLAEIHEYLSHGALDLVREGERGLSLEPVLKRLNAYRALEDAVDVSALPYSGPPNKEEERRVEAGRTLSLPASYAAEIHDGARQMMFLLGYLRKPDLHVLGDAGDGKTHLACWICDERTSNGLPAVFLPGAGFTAEGGLERQVRDLLDIPPSRSWGDFVRALDAAAQAHRTRIPIVIDGLNEAVRNGAVSTVWRTHLSGLVEEISRTPNVALVTTSRSSYRTAIWSGGGMPENVTFVDGFGFHEVEEAIDKYFSAYKIRADLTAAPLEQFEHPIYLKLFCEAKNPERREWVDVYVGEETLFEVFDQYLARCDAEVVGRLALRPGTRAVSLPLQRMASHLWRHRSRSVPVAEAARLVDGEELDHLHWPSSKTQAMESEGLLVCRDWIGEGEAYVVTYDLMAGYMIARHLLDEYEGLAGFFDSDGAVELLFAEDLQKRHPLHEDIRRALAALAPKLGGRHLHELTDNETAVSDSLHALFETAPEHVGESGVRLVTERFAEEAHRQRLLDLSSVVLARPGHPLNADYWHERLKELPLPERDLSWSEHVRRYQGQAGTLVSLLEQYCVETNEPPIEVADRLRLLAKHATWVLTSTVKDLRDRATRALYWYGRRFPDEFFALVAESLGIDDPYVSERMLAACYGVAMARRYDPADRGFVEHSLPGWAQALYDAVFAPQAPHATTHLLARNYARRTIEIAARHRPDVLAGEQLERTRPPYEEGGVRDWGESEDRNDGDYREGNNPIGLLDADPMDRLGPDISKYQSNTPQYKRAKANLWWRIYDLGYSFESFGSVDRQLASASYRRSSHEDDGRVTGYGRKYSWIATCELAGLRDDLGLLKSEWDTEEENWTHVDLDPSFPEELPGHELVPGDLLGDRQQSLRDWITSGPSRTFEETLVLDELQGERGPWVLLWGYISQDDPGARRRMFCFLQGALLDASEAEKVAGAVGPVENVDLLAIHVPETHYTYAGEIPWCETYPRNEPFSVAITTGYESVTRTENETRYFRGDERMSREEYFGAVLERFPGDPADASRPREGETLFAAKERVARKPGIRQSKESVTKEVEIPINIDCEVAMPVRRHGWESYHSELNPSPGAYTPARQIADVLGLVGRPQTFDLYESGGRRASATFRYGGQFSDRQHFTYLRKDLLDRYLEESGQAMFWNIFGERALRDPDTGAIDPVGEGPPHVRYEEIRTYELAGP